MKAVISQTIFTAMATTHGADRMRLIADPAIDRNVHHLVARGAAGEVEFTSRNVPFPENPKTSYLAALSAIAVLGNLGSSLRIG